jgi:uncharacterized protein (TIGR00730 family)
MTRMLTVFTGSASGTSPRHAQAVDAFAQTLVEAGIGAVYGGGHVGLMGVLADGVHRRGGEVIGVMPKHLVDKEIADTRLTRLETVNGMHERKARMAELGDGFVALPGGIGTLEELFEAWTWQQIGIHRKPVALLDVDGFWDPLLGMVRSMADDGFLSPSYIDALIVEDDPHRLLAALEAWTPPPAKWDA